MIAYESRNAARPNSQFELATRFIALASVGNTSKNKFIYALNVTAVDKMRLTDLVQKTTNEIPCPYDSMKFSISGNKSANDAAQTNQYFYDINASDDHQHRKRGKFIQGGNHQQKRPRQPNFDQGKQFKSIRFQMHFATCIELLEFIVRYLKKNNNRILINFFYLFLLF